MLIHRDYKLEKLVSDERTRGGRTDQVRFEAQEKVLLATDGMALVVVPVKECEQDVSGFISPETIKSARKAGSTTPYHGLLRAKTAGEIYLKDGSMHPRVDPKEDYLNFSPIFASMQPTVRIGLSVQRLHDMAMAMGATGDKQVTLEITLDAETSDGRRSTTAPIGVTVHEDPGPRGALMPRTVG